MAIMTNGGRMIGQTREGIGASTAGQFDKFQMDATPKYAVGTMIETADGKRYRYAQFDANTNRGVLVAQDFSQVSLPDDDNHVVAPASATAVSFETPKPGAIGSSVIQVTLASITTNQFLGATLAITDDTGEGFSYDIVGNTATDTPVTGDFYLFIRQKLVVALSTDSDISIVANPWNNLEVATTATDALVAGVTCNTMVVATAAYGWVQTKGLCGVLQDAQPGTVGDTMQLSALTAGAVGILGGTVAGSLGDMNTQGIVGRLADIGDSTGHSVVWLSIE